MDSEGVLKAKGGERRFVLSKDKRDQRTAQFQRLPVILVLILQVGASEGIVWQDVAEMLAVGLKN